MLNIGYKATFLRQFAKLSPALQDEVEEKISAFQRNPRDPSLKTHKLHGEMDGCWSFSVNYKYRIVFFYESKNTAVLLAVGDHSVYE